MSNHNTSSMSKRWIASAPLTPPVALQAFTLHPDYMLNLAKVFLHNLRTIHMFSPRPVHWKIELESQEEREKHKEHEFIVNPILHAICSTCVGIPVSP